MTEYKKLYDENDHNYQNIIYIIYMYIYTFQVFDINLSSMYVNINMRVKFKELDFCLKIRSARYLIIKASKPIAEKIKTRIIFYEHRARKRFL